MKRLLTLFGILLSIVSFAQNRSLGMVGSLTPAIPNEIFRFRPGVVTQLDQGSTFDPGNRFFRLGRFPNGSQTAYGLNFVAHGKALALGYTDLMSLNPSIVWKGQSPSSLGDLEFRYASTFTPGITRLSATMRNDGSTVFGFNIPSSLDNVKSASILGWNMACR